MLECFNPEGAPKVLGPYSHVVKAGPLVFISGQLPIDPKEGKIVSIDIEGQTKRVLENIKTLLLTQNLSFDHVCRCDIFLTDLNNFATVNKIYAEAFSGKIKPARQTVEVSALPLQALIEISCIAYLGED